VFLLERRVETTAHADHTVDVKNESLHLARAGSRPNHACTCSMFCRIASSGGTL
jgi:hypothetical protein